MAIVEQGKNGTPADENHLAALGITPETAFNPNVGFILHLWREDDTEGDLYYLPSGYSRNLLEFELEGSAGPYHILITNINENDWSYAKAHFWKDDFVQREELQEAVDEKANTDGDYPEMRSGDLVNKASEDVEFLYKQTSSPSGKAVLDIIKGKSLVWNQLANYAEFDTPTVSGITITNNNNGSFTVNGTATANSYCGVVIPIVSGHKYLVSGCPAGGSDSTYHIRFVVGESTYFEVGGGLIVTATSDTMTLFVRVTSGTTVSNLKFYPQTIDLTLMFGAGNEPSTVEEFQAMYHDQYYEYNSGELINNAADIIKVIGFNQLVSEPINLVSHSFPAFDKAIYTKVRGGIQYYIHHDALSVTNWRHAYKIFDLEGNEITQKAFKQVPYGNPYYHPTNHYWLDGSNNTVYNTPVTFNQDCYIYIGYNSGGVTATTEMTNVCLNIFNSELNGQYKQYISNEVNIGLNSIKVKSHNIWDEEWEVETYFKSKNYIPVLGGLDYYFCVKNYISQGFRISTFNSNKEFIGYVGYAMDYGHWGYANHIITMPSDTAFVKFELYTSYSTTYKNDICINLSDPAFNGQYEPYGDNGVIEITGGLKSVGTIYDELGNYKFIKRFGEVDLGTLDYELLSGTVFRSSTTLPAKDLGVYRLVNAINVKYEQKPRSVSYSTLLDKQYKFDSSSLKMYFNDSVSSNVEQFKSNNTGIKLYYELATPVEYDLVSEIPNSYPVYEGGTEEILSDTIVAPFVGVVKYPLDAAGVISDLTQSFTNLLNALKAASVISDGSVTKSGTTYTFTITA